MRLAPRSLRGRLLVSGAAAVLAALLLAAAGIGHVLERFVVQSLDRQLDAQIAVVARAVRPDGSVDAARVVEIPPFGERGSGWSWRASAPGHDGGGSLPSDDPHAPRLNGSNHPRPFEARGPDGERIHGRALVVPTPAGPVRIVATAPRALVERPLRAVRTPLLLSMAALGLALIGAILLQLRYGLRPVAALAAMLEEVGAGRRARVEVDEPTELVPLANALNALLDANEAQLARARLHVANLAHGLKTPLATLRLDLADAGRDPDGRLARQIERIEGQVRHHLSRARAADAGVVAAVPLAPVLSDLTVALRRIHADRRRLVDVTIAPELAVRCDQQDLDEALGNLLDNAWRYADRAITIVAEAAAREVRIAIEDDGTGLSDAALSDMQAGTLRSDEHAGGYGQGIRIARELIELHGGSLAFARGRSGGLLVRLTLPAA